LFERAIVQFLVVPVGSSSGWQSCWLAVVQLGVILQPKKITGINITFQIILVFVKQSRVGNAYYQIVKLNF